MTSGLRVNAGRYIGRCGRTFRLNHEGVESVVMGRLWQMRTGVRLSAAGGFTFLTAATVYEFLADADAAAREGDLIEEAVDGGRRWLLYADFDHKVGETTSHLKYFALRVNVDDAVVERYTEAAGPMGGTTDATAVVARNVVGHFWTANAGTRMGADGRSAEYEGVLVTRNGLGIAAGDVATIGGVQYEVVGTDDEALGGLRVYRLGRMK